MARKKTSTHGDSGDRLLVPTSSGYKLVIRRPPMQVLRAVMQKSEELHPLPEVPTEEVETVTGDKQRVPAINLDLIRKLDTAVSNEEQGAVLDQLTDEEIAFWRTRQQASYQQNEYVLDWALNRRVDVEGCYTEEQRAELVAKFADERTDLEEYGSLDEELLALDPFQFVLRVFIIQDASDYAAVTAAVMRSMDASDIDPEEIRSRASFLRS